MPVYSYECPEHGEFDSYAPVENMKEDQKCSKCGAMSPYKFKLHKFVADIYKPYVDSNIMSDPVLIESRAQKKQLLASQGLVEV